jgi:hypothetical protein
MLALVKMPAETIKNNVFVARSFSMFTKIVLVSVQSKAQTNQIGVWYSRAPLTSCNYQLPLINSLG